MIPDTLLRFMEDSLHMVLPKGNMPPDIQGEFMLYPREMYFHNGSESLQHSYDTVYFRFGGEAAPLVTTIDTQLHLGDTLIIGADTTVLQADSVIQVMDTVFYYPNGQHNQLMPCDILENGFSSPVAISKAVVMGSGNAFTVYFTLTYPVEVDEVEYQLTRGYIITGLVTEMGIDNIVMACINISISDLNNNSNGTAVVDPSDIVNRFYGYRVKSNTPGNPFGSAIRKKWYNL